MAETFRRAVEKVEGQNERARRLASERRGRSARIRI